MEVEAEAVGYKACGGIRGVQGVLGAQMWVFFWVTWPDEPQ